MIKVPCNNFLIALLLKCCVRWINQIVGVDHKVACASPATIEALNGEVPELTVIKIAHSRRCTDGQGRLFL